MLTTEDPTRRVGELKAANDLSAPPSVTLDNDRKPILVARNLSKAFGKATAVDAINFEVVAQLVAQGYENVTMLDDNFILDKECVF